MNKALAVQRVVCACFFKDARMATLYLSPNFIIRATRRFREDKRFSRTEILLTIGKPNYRERKFVKLCQKASVDFPIREVQMNWYKNKKDK